jgi:hypothetical protein
LIHIKNALTKNELSQQQRKPGKIISMPRIKSIDSIALIIKLMIAISSKIPFNKSIRKQLVINNLKALSSLN